MNDKKHGRVCCKIQLRGTIFSEDKINFKKSEISDTFLFISINQILQICNELHP